MDLINPDIPNVQHGSQEYYRRLYYSNPEAALKVPITVQAGYGKLLIGMIVAQNVSAGGPNKGKFVPYNPTLWTGGEHHPGRVFVVNDIAAAATDLYVPEEESYKFQVGDDLILHQLTGTAENLGAITGIDRETDYYRAKITFTTAVTAEFKTANKAYVAVEAGKATNNFSDCVGFLEKTVDTGLGPQAAGAHCTLVLGNAVVYNASIHNCDTKAKEALTAASLGQYIYMR